MQRSAIFIALSLLAMPTQATVINVPGDQPTIQAGIDVAANGDTVLVAPGTYIGAGNRAIDLGGKQLMVSSQSGAESTVIDCEGLSGGAFLFLSGEDSLTVIDGFTLTGVIDTANGAVTCDPGSPTIRNCIITNNDSDGLYAYQSSPHIEDCLITNNSRNGVYSFAGNPIRIIDCEISGNGYSGVSIAWGGSGLEMSNCLFKDNGEYGLLIYTVIENYYVTNCTFVGNGTGMEFRFVFPKAGSTERSIDSVAVMNNIFAYNDRKGLVSDQFFNVSAIMRCNNSYGNPSGDYVHGLIDSAISFGNLSLNPQFCSYAGQRFGLMANSPCSPDHNDCSVQMGAFPVDSTCVFCCIGLTGNINADPDEAIDISDLTYLVAFMFGGGTEPPCLEETDVNGTPPLDISDLTYFVAYMFGGGLTPAACP